MYNINLALLAILAGFLTFFGALSHRVLRVASIVIGIVGTLVFAFLYLKPDTMEFIRMGVFAMSFNLTDISRFFLWIIISSFAFTPSTNP